MTQRSNRYGTVPGYFEQINDNLCALVQIENRKGVDAAEDICAVEGVDGIFIGPNDLAAACGHLGNPNHPEVQAVIVRIFAAARQAGKAVGPRGSMSRFVARPRPRGASLVPAQKLSHAGVSRNIYCINIWRGKQALLLMLWQPLAAGWI